jgi:hypothetical protein
MSTRNLAKELEEAGGFEAIKKAFDASEERAATLHGNKTRSVSGWRAVGVLGYITKLESSKVRIGFQQFAGICHASSRNILKDVAVIFSYPVVEEAKRNTYYPKGFLDSFYTWLTTESHVKDVFYEPWNGEYLSVNPFKPLSKCLLALIASRTPSERFSVNKFWTRAVLEKKVPWFESLIMVHNVIGRGDSEDYYCIPAYGTSAHSPYPFSSIDEKELAFLLTQELITEKKLKEGSTDLPWNDLKASWGGVWKSVGFGRSEYRLSPMVTKFIDDVYKKNGWVEEKRPWGDREHGRNDKTLRKEEAIDSIIDEFLKLFESVKQVKAG